MSVKPTSWFIEPEAPGAVERDRQRLRRALRLIGVNEPMFEPEKPMHLPCRYETRGQGAGSFEVCVVHDALAYRPGYCYARLIRDDTLARLTLGPRTLAEAPLSHETPLYDAVKRDMS